MAGNVSIRNAHLSPELGRRWVERLNVAKAALVAETWRCTRCKSTIMHEGNVKRLDFNGRTYLLCPACVTELGWFLNPVGRNVSNARAGHTKGEKKR